MKICIREFHFRGQQRVQTFPAVLNLLPVYMVALKSVPASSVVTDGAPEMVGRNNGLVGQLENNGVNFLTFHCIIHQEVLCSKSLQMSDIMCNVSAIVNLIRALNKAQRNRKFVQFLKDLDAKYEDVLPPPSKNSMVECRKQFAAFFPCEKKSYCFCRMNLKARKSMKSFYFIASLAFITNISTQFNIFNKKL